MMDGLTSRQQRVVVADPHFRAPLAYRIGKGPQSGQRRSAGLSRALGPPRMSPVLAGLPSASGHAVGRPSGHAEYRLSP